MLPRNPFAALSPLSSLGFQVCDNRPGGFESAFWGLNSSSRAISLTRLVPPIRRVVTTIMENAGSWAEKDDYKSSTRELSRNTEGTMLTPSSELSRLQRGIRKILLRRLESQGMLGHSSLLDSTLTHWQGKNLWGLPECRVQMGLNECGDGNDDNYSNSSPSLCPWEAKAASVI